MRIQSLKNKKNITINERKTIMKNARRIMTLALALILTLALIIPAFAAEETPKGGTIKVEGAELQDTSKYTKYSVYKMFDVFDGKNANENKYKATADWIAFVQKTELEPYFEVQITNDGAYMIWRKNTASTADAAAIAELARAYAKENNLSTVATVVVNGDAQPVTDNGYYLLVPSNTTASGVIVVKNGENKIITEKSVAPGMPTIVKEVYEDSAVGYRSSNTVDIGQTFSYKITITAGQGASNYILHDKVDEHIQIDRASRSITRGGNPVSEDEYEVHTENICKDCTFHIVFDKEWCAGLNEGAVIVITYNAKLLAKDADGKLIETDKDHANTAWLTHTEQNVETPKSTVATQTRQVNILKVDQDKNPLAGAGFVLRDNEGRYFVQNDAGEVSWIKEGEGTPTEFVSDAEGKLCFYGVDAEIYTLDESTVPGGYTGVDGTQANLKTASINADNPIEIINHLGQKLPETGGIGTTVFYVAGVALVLCTLAALVIIKRKETSAQ